MPKPCKPLTTRRSRLVSWQDTDLLHTVLSRWILQYTWKLQWCYTRWELLKPTIHPSIHSSIHRTAFIHQHTSSVTKYLNHISIHTYSYTCSPPLNPPLWATPMSLHRIICVSFRPKFVAHATKVKATNTHKYTPFTPHTCHAARCCPALPLTLPHILLCRCDVLK